MSEDPAARSISSSVQRAELLIAQGRGDEALALIDEGLAQAHDEPRLLLLRASLLINLGRSASARETLEVLTAIEPDAIPPRYLLSHALAQLGDIRAAEAAILSCLAAEPENPAFHLQYASLLTHPAGASRGARRRRKLAQEHVGTALGLDPERAESYLWAASIAKRSERSAEAKAFAEQGLALAPDDIELLTLHADLTVATVAPTSRYDPFTVLATQVAETSKLLAHSPQHTEARRALFVQLWWQRMLLVDAPLALLPVLAVAIAGSFREGGQLSLLIAAVIVFVLFGAIRLAVFGVVTGRASAGFRELMDRGSPFPRVRRWCTLFAWCAGGAGAVAMLLLRDPVAIRWLIVWLGLAALAAVAASLIWQIGYAVSVRLAGGFAPDPDMVYRLAERRRGFRARLILRSAGVLGIAVLLSYAVGAGRTDAIGPAIIGAGGLVLSPIAGMLVTRRMEREARRGLPEGSVLQHGDRAPGPVGLVCALALGLAAAVAVAVGTIALPVLPNAHDGEGRYKLIAPGVGEDADRCAGGRPASRLACLLDEDRLPHEDLEPPEVDFPRFDDSDFELPDVRVPDLEVPRVVAP